MDFHTPVTNKFLEKQLNKNGYFQSKLVPGLWAHRTCRPNTLARSTCFTYNLPSNNTTNAVLIGQVPATLVSLWIGTMLVVKYISPCQATKRKPCVNSNISCRQYHNTPRLNAHQSTTVPRNNLPSKNPRLRSSIRMTNVSSIVFPASTPMPHQHHCFAISKTHNRHNETNTSIT